MAFTYNELIWTSPEGNEFTFVYDGTISDGITHNLSEFTFANTDDTYFQDRTISHDDYGFSLYITDQDTLTDLRAAFEEKVTPGKTGTLQHPDPSIGTFNCVVSSVKFDQNSVKGMGVCTISVVFHKQIKNLLGGDTSESATPASASAVYDAVSSANETQAEALSDSITTDSTAGNTTLINTATSYVSKINDKLASLSSKVDAVNVLFTNTYSSVVNNITDVVDDALKTAQQIQTLIQLPMLATESVKDRISAYKKLCDSILGTSLSSSTDDDTSTTNGLTSADETNINNGNAEGKNTIAMAGMVSLAAISAVCYSAATGESITDAEIVSGTITDTDNKYLSRTEIAKTILDIQNMAQTVTETLSEWAQNFGSAAPELSGESTLLFFDQYFDYSILNKSLIAGTVKNLNNRLLNASSEKIYVTERAINIVPLCYKIYGTINVNTIKFLITSNELHGNSLYLVPKGTEIKYY